MCQAKKASTSYLKRRESWEDMNSTGNKSHYCWLISSYKLCVSRQNPIFSSSQFNPMVATFKLDYPSNSVWYTGFGDSVHITNDLSKLSLPNEYHGQEHQCWITCFRGQFLLCAILLAAYIILTSQITCYRDNFLIVGCMWRD